MTSREEYLQRCNVCEKQPTILIPCIKQQSDEILNMTEDGYICLNCIAEHTKNKIEEDRITSQEERLLFWKKSLNDYH